MANRNDTAPAGAATTPIQRMFQEWAAIYAAQIGQDGFPPRLLELEDAIEAEEPTGPLDLAAKIAALTGFGAIYIPGLSAV